MERTGLEGERRTRRDEAILVFVIRPMDDNHYKQPQGPPIIEAKPRGEGKIDLPTLGKIETPCGLTATLEWADVLVLGRFVPTSSHR